MRTLWKILLALALVLPLGGFVAGSLVSAAADEPAHRHTIVIQDSPTGSPSASPSARSADDGPSHDVADDHGGQRGDGGGVTVLSPDPDDLDSTADDDGRDDDPADDHGNSGPGSDDSGHGGGDDNSGHDSSGHDGGGDDD